MGPIPKGALFRITRSEPRDVEYRRKVEKHELNAGDPRGAEEAGVVDCAGVVDHDGVAVLSVHVQAWDAGCRRILFKKILTALNWKKGGHFMFGL